LRHLRKISKINKLMKKLFFILFSIIAFAFYVNAQEDQQISAQHDQIAKVQYDQIFKHNGETIEGNVLRITEYSVVFKYAGEDAENTLSKYAVEKIIHGRSQRIEEISEKIIVEGPEDWEKVVILVDKNLIAGLKKGSEIRGKTSFVNFHTANTGDKKAMKKMKQEAAASQCPFILILTEKASVGSSSNNLGGSQAVKTGISYCY